MLPTRTTTSAYQNMLTRHVLLRAELRRLTTKQFLNSSSPTPINLDTLDHVGSIGSIFDHNFTANDLKYRSGTKSVEFTGSADTQVIRTWARSHLDNSSFDPMIPRGFDKNRIVLSKGIRHSLNGIMTHFKESNTNLIFYVPTDIYPVYGHIASRVGVRHSAYQTIFNSGFLRYLGFMNNKKIESSPTNLRPEDHNSTEVAVIADPMPLSRTTITRKDRDLILRWLSDSKNRFLIIDSVYSASFNQALEPLLATNKVFYLNSLSKSHCLPNALGFNIIPPEFESVLKASLEKELTDQTLRSVDVMLGVYTQKDTMCFQSDFFSRAWKSINQQLIDRGFSETVPEMGIGQCSYLKTYQIPYETLLKSNIITIPPDVYERPEMNSTLTIMSCLDQSKVLIEKSAKIPKTMYHVTLLSNFSKAYDKYTNQYNKTKLPESTFLDKFHVLTAPDIWMGIEKTSRLLKKLGIINDKLILIETKIPDDQELFRTENTGKGYFIKLPHIIVSDLYILDETPDNHETFGHRSRVSVETIMARSMALNKDNFKSYQDLTPRSISILPVAQGCQAKCSFCFSHSSVSDDTSQKLLKHHIIDHVLNVSKKHGAERVVITGGGEPTLVPHHRLIEYIKLCKIYFDKIVMITNGYVYSNQKVNEEQRLEYLTQIHEAGLNVLSVSRHGYDETTNTEIMNLETNSVKIAQTIASNPKVFENLQLRWVCVLQKHGVSSVATLEKYLDFAVETKASQICFKELYVSVSEESVYYDKSYNKFSRKNQIPLSMVTKYLEDKKAKLMFELPWGSPVYELMHLGSKIQIACYTEPSLFWERSSGICRSWNLMADGKVYASLEDLKSQINP